MRHKNILLICIALLSSTQLFAVDQDKKQSNWLYLGTGEHIEPLRRQEVTCDVAVIGGGMSGIAAAVSAARQGANVVLVNDRPVLGGNASSEIRVTVNSADCERNSGISEEILIDNIKYNPQESYTVWDHVLYDYVTREPNITLMLNTSAIKATRKRDAIESVICWQLTTESEITIKAEVFVDCTGDGTVAASAGAEYRTGREGKAEFGEQYAPDEPDGWVMGESIMMITRDLGRPVEYFAPSFAKPYDPELSKYRKIVTLKEGFWWLELGSDYDVIADRPKNQHELLGYIYGIWDYIKNSGAYPESKTLALDWVGSLPGRRESRRLEGDYILNEVDLLSYREFEDAVAWGGWSLDEHAPGGILTPSEPASYFHARFTRPYQIPYRSLYSRNIDNLLFAGRNASVSHIALSSTRIIETCMSMGQAVGVAAAMCCEKGIEPRDIYSDGHIEELQERLLRQNYYIPYLPAKDPNNKAKSAEIVASSTLSGDVANLLDGVSRDEQGENHHWMSKGNEAQLELSWEEEVTLSSIEFKFDSNTDAPLMMHKNQTKYEYDDRRIPEELVKSATIEAKVDGDWQVVATINDNIRSYLPIALDKVKCDRIRISLHETHGATNIKLFELRCY
ncbi:MAG: FAD-dependent oxidoreductase [Rikenellaceae bacterium]